MKTAVYLVTFFIGISFHNAKASTPSIKHSHNGREHSHILPASGIKHFHKHMHNGRAHIHPYSAKVGFKHSHSLSPRAKAWANAVKHEHEGRPHSHPLPISGIKHDHRHVHGGRSHIHPLPVSGSKHSHDLIKKTASSSKDTKTPFDRGLNIKEEMAAVLSMQLREMPKTNFNQSSKTSVVKPSKTINLSDKNYRDLLTLNKNSPKLNNDKRKKPIIKNSTIKKILAYDSNQHDGRSHQHNLPVIAKNLTYKKLLSKEKFSTKRKVKTAKKQKKSKYKFVNKKKILKPVVKTTKSPEPATRQTPEQIASGNRQFNIALGYENGNGIKKNLPQAFNWYLRAAKQGNSKAQFNLASLYEKGEGVDRNIPQAIRWYYSAASNGNVNAQLNLANKYASGNSVTKNINKATYWYKRAADQGDMRGNANLIYLLEGINGDLEEK